MYPWSIYSMHILVDLWFLSPIIPSTKIHCNLQPASAACYKLLFKEQLRHLLLIAKCRPPGELRSHPPSSFQAIIPIVLGLRDRWRISLAIFSSRCSSCTRYAWKVCHLVRLLVYLAPCNEPPRRNFLLSLTVPHHDPPPCLWFSEAEPEREDLCYLASSLFYMSMPWLTDTREKEKRGKGMSLLWHEKWVQM